MKPSVKNGLKKAGEWVALLVVFGGLGSLWINTEVERRMKELLPVVADDPVVVQLVTNDAHTTAAIIRIESKVDAFSNKFIAYLERQAQVND